jgi:hypothetical protein
MATVMGAFKSGVSKERQQALLDGLAGRPGVGAAKLTKEDAKSPDMRLLFYVRADEDCAESIIEELRRHDDIAVAEMAARRSLA